jgi:hypothetical protein
VQGAERQATARQMVVQRRLAQRQHAQRPTTALERTNLGTQGCEARVSSFFKLFQNHDNPYVRFLFFSFFVLPGRPS